MSKDVAANECIFTANDNTTRQFCFHPPVCFGVNKTLGSVHTEPFQLNIVSDVAKIIAIALCERTLIRQHGVLGLT